MPIKLYFYAIVGWLLFFSIVPILSWAELSNAVFVIGVVQNFDANQVTLKTKSGMTQVPRSSIPNSENLRPGQKVKASVDFIELIQMNKKRMPKRAYSSTPAN